MANGALQFPITLTLDGVDHELVAGATDIIRLERRYDVALAGMITDGGLGGDFRIEYLAFMAWSAALRTGVITDANFDAWLEAGRFELALRDEDVEDQAPEANAASGG